MGKEVHAAESRSTVRTESTQCGSGYDEFIAAKRTVDHFDEPVDVAVNKVEQFEQDVKKKFLEQPGQMRLLIVVDKLLTGFDAPRNTVLYLTRQLKDHTLLQAIARVNRLCDGKDFGYIIDYRGVLQNLNKAFDLYGKMEEYDAADLEAALTDVAGEIDKLPRLHTELLDVFRDVKNKHDEEQYERLLAEPEVRERFYESLRDFGRALTVALSSTRFIEQTPDGAGPTWG